MLIHLRNPHSVEAALSTRPKDVLEVVVPSKELNGAWENVAKLAKSLGVRVSNSSSNRSPQSQSGGSSRGGPSHGPSRGPSRSMKSDESLRQGLAEAVVKERSGVAIEELVRDAKSRNGGKGLWLALDHVQDPHNLGAIFRSASFFGVQGILLTQEHSAPMTGTVYDVASGGVEHVPFTIQPNLQRGFEVAKEAGLWILGSSEHAHDDLQSVEADRPWLLVLGNEEKGMRRLTEESCDVLCKISAKGKVSSLNVAVASGVMMSYLTR